MEDSMMQFCVMSVLLSLLCLHAEAQFSTSSREADTIVLNNRLGFAGSMMSGYGLSYEYFVTRDYLIEFSGSVYGEGGNMETANYNSRSYLTAAVGMELQRNMYFHGNTRLYGLLGTSVWIDNEKRYYDKTNDDKTAWAIGLGIGLEYTISRRFVINLEGGYHYKTYNNSGIRIKYNQWDPNKQEYVATYENYIESPYVIGFAIGGGLYYAF
jgi:hypothetical protein